MPEATEADTPTPPKPKVKSNGIEYSPAILDN